MPRHRFVEHTGELELHLHAADLAALFEEAARALAQTMAEDARGAPTQPEAHVEITSADRETLLVDWLNELVGRAEIEKCVYWDVHVTRANDTHLEATVRGRAPTSPRTAVKAATWHRVRVSPTPTGVDATIVLDV